MDSNLLAEEQPSNNPLEPSSPKSVNSSPSPEHQESSLSIINSNLIVPADIVIIPENEILIPADAVRVGNPQVTYGFGVDFYSSDRSTLSLQVPLNGDRKMLLTWSQGEQNPNKKGDVSLYLKSVFPDLLKSSVVTEHKLKLGSDSKITYSNKVSGKLPRISFVRASVKLSGGLTRKGKLGFFKLKNTKLGFFGELHAMDVSNLVDERRVASFECIEARELLLQNSYNMALRIKLPSILSGGGTASEERIIDAGGVDHINNVNPTGEKEHVICIEAQPVSNVTRTSPFSHFSVITVISCVLLGVVVVFQCFKFINKKK